MLISPIQRRWDSLSFGTRWTERAFQSKALKAVEEVERVARQQPSRRVRCQVLRLRGVLGRLAGRDTVSKIPLYSPST